MSWYHQPACLLLCLAPSPVPVPEPEPELAPAPSEEDSASGHSPPTPFTLSRALEDPRRPASPRLQRSMSSLAAAAGLGAPGSSLPDPRRLGSDKHLFAAPLPLALAHSPSWLSDALSLRCRASLPASSSLIGSAPGTPRPRISWKVERAD